MATFSKIVKGLPRDERLLHCHRLDDNSYAAKQRIALGQNFSAELSLDDYGDFQEIPSRNPAIQSAANRLDIAFRIRFAGKYRHQGRRVENHLGSPCSSYRNSAWSR